ncbi:alpha/beta hydrolase [Ereboglobus luteus]|uniref:Endo-1,4-beta-xylanase n=1 Tax=Ereboglobus luteus TaxID=1796921 RepID=A0A2U8E3H2_9BACT|nr:alpha/beta hydrolase [Ereboglobus luteus]AWI09335.1 endo-1,4-beta-xylanase [Ereboglobus luteus]
MTTDTIPLWKDAAPGALGSAPTDIPTLTRHAAANPNGATMLIVPGGGYCSLTGHEGAGFAPWFTQRGITSFVLTYRLASNGYRHPCMMLDVLRAMRLVRHLARKEGRDPSRAGIIGCSAGGHLASTALTHYDAGRPGGDDPVERESARPDLGVLCYPVISCGTSAAHAGSMDNLLGPNPPADLAWQMSTETQVTPQTPPTFLWHTLEDPVVSVENSMLFANALRRASVPFALHVFEKGGHGLGMLPGSPPWTVCLEGWLRERKFV